MSNERRRRELEVLGAADALVSLWERGGSSRFLGETAEAVRNAMLALRSFEDDEAVAEAAYERAVADPLAEGSEWGLTQQAGLPVDQQSMPPGQAEEPVNCWLPPGASVRYDPEGPWPRSVQLPPHDERGVIAVAESALGKLCLEVATARWARHKLHRPSWRGDGEEVRLVWDEFLSGHDARLLP